jgi:CMP-N-acetylneuraminic acid synthetase
MSAAKDRVLGLIPAKGASTRFPRKNVALLGGRTLLEWAAAAARESGVVDRLVLSSEDDAVIAAAREAGIEAPFRRPDHLARDPAGIVDVALHALAELEAAGSTYETLIILPPTSPFRSAEDIRVAYALFLKHGRSFVMSVCEFSHTPFAAMKIAPDGTLQAHFPEYLGRKSQEMPKAYRPNGAVHVLDVPRFRAARSYFAPPLVPYVMPADRSVDVDHPRDLEIAELMLATRRGD